MPSKKIIKGISLLLVLLGLWVTSWFLPFAAWIKAFTEWVEKQGTIGIVVFVGGYIVGTVLFVPGSLLTIAAGVVFGVGWGALISLVGATVGATLAFLIGRYLARESVERWAAHHRTFQALDSAIGSQDWKVIGLLRLSPVVPFNLSNYIFGITKARLWAYVAASFIGMAPGSLLYAYLGHVGKATFGEKRSSLSTEQIVLLIVGFVATAGVAWYLTRLARRELKKQQQTTSDTLPADSAQL